MKKYMLSAAILLAITATRTSAQTQATANTWTVGAKTYTADGADAESSFDAASNSDKWKFFAHSMTGDPGSYHIHSISFFFGTTAAPKPGKYLVVDVSAPAKANTVSVVTDDNDPGIDEIAYSSTGTDKQYITVTLTDGQVTIAMPPISAVSNDMAKKVKLSTASLSIIKDKEE